MSLENYPGVSLADARRLVKDFRAKITLGHDSQAEKFERRREAVKALEDLGLAWTMSRLCDEYFTRYVEHRVKHLQIVKARIENDIKPVSPQRSSDRIQLHPQASKEDVQPRHQARGLRIDPANVLGPEDAGGIEKPRDRALSKEELTLFLKARRSIPHRSCVRETSESESSLACDRTSSKN